MNVNNSYKKNFLLLKEKDDEYDEEDDLFLPKTQTEEYPQKKIIFAKTKQMLKLIKEIKAVNPYNLSSTKEINNYDFTPLLLMKDKKKCKT